MIRQERYFLFRLYDIPSEENVKEVVVNEEAVLHGARPLVVTGTDEAAAEEPAEEPAESA